MGIREAWKSAGCVWTAKDNDDPGVRRWKMFVRTCAVGAFASALLPMIIAVIVQK
jgi:hypothetical protein